MDTFAIHRRHFLQGASALALLTPDALRAQEKKQEEKEVEAAEDLMREHGVLRRDRRIRADVPAPRGHRGHRGLPGVGLSDLASFTAPLPPKAR